MGSKHRSKSGTAARRQTKPAARETTGISLSMEARRILDEGMKVAAPFASNTPLSHDTFVERFVTLITSHGTLMCWAALKETLPARNVTQRKRWRGPAFAALAKLGMLQEARTYMKLLAFDPMQRVASLTLMADSVSGTIKDEILTELEALSQRTSDPIVRIKIQSRLFQFTPSRYQHLVPALQLALRDLLARADHLGMYEAVTLTSLALLWPEQRTFPETIFALERIRDPRARQGAEEHLFIGFAHLFKHQLLHLADVVSGSCYEAGIRELAKTARTPDALESDDFVAHPSSPTPSTA